MMTMKLLAAILGLLITAAPFTPASADEPNPPRHADRLVNLDAAGIADKGQIGGGLDLRVFSGDEDLTYVSLALRYGLAENVEAMVRGSFTDTANLGIPGGATIRHGGSDVEVLLKVAGHPTEQSKGTSRVAGLIGVSFPSTPAQGDAVVTLGGSFSFTSNKVSLHLNPRAVFPNDNTIIGIGLGAAFELGSNFSVVGDYTPIIAGDNTRDTTTGALQSRDVYGAAIRYASADGRWHADLGYSNALGQTTGFSLSPGLGGSGAFYVSVSFRR
jgi:hypothetical protein